MTETKLSAQHERIIETWMFTTIKDGGIDRYDDLHVDQIDQAWRSRNTWVEGGLEALRIATNLRDRHRVGLTIALAFALEVSERTSGVDFSTLEELEPRLNWMPPSLYLLRPGEEFWNQTERTPDGKIVAERISVKQFDTNIFAKVEFVKACYYMEFKQIDTDEHSRSIFLVG